MAQDPLNLLGIEPRFPGRLGWVADWLVRKRGYRCQFYFHQADPPELWPESVGKGLEPIAFNVGGVAREPSVHWTRGLERGLCYAYGGWEVIDARRPRPIDLILGRSAGLGSTLFAPVSLPGVPMVNYFDYFYHPRAHDLAGASDVPMPVEYAQWRRAANAMDLLDLENGVVAWAPTDWQRDLYPVEYRDEFTVLYDGVNTRRFVQSPEGAPRSIGGRAIPEGFKVVSFVARVPDWVRGFDRFVSLANRLLRARRDVLCVVAGGGPVRRMLDVRFHGQDYAVIVQGTEPPVDPERFWMLGSLPTAGVAALLATSDLHIDASRPYIVSRATIEAMASGAVVLASESAPIREFIEPGRTGLLAPPDDPEAMARLALEVLDDPAAHRPLGRAASEVVRERFARDVTLPRLAAWFDRLAGAGR